MHTICLTRHLADRHRDLLILVTYHARLMGHCYVAELENEIIYLLPRVRLNINLTRNDLALSSGTSTKRVGICDAFGLGPTLKGLFGN